MVDDICLGVVVVLPVAIEAFMFEVVDVDIFVSVVELD